MKPWQQTEKAFDKRLPDAYIHTFTDASKVRGFMKGVSGGAAVRGTSLPQPADKLVTLRGRTFLCDVKHCENATSFSFADIRPAQWMAGKGTVRAGGEYRFAIYAKQRDTWFFVPFQVIDGHQRKSIRWDELAQFTWTDPNVLP